MLVALVVVGLFAWTYFGGVSEMNASIAVPLVPGVDAVITFVVTLALYFTAPINKLRSAATISYLLLVVTLFSLLFTTKGIDSSFLSLYIAVIPFAPFFGLAGTALGFASIAALMVWEYLLVGILPDRLFALAVMAGGPLIAGFLVWGKGSPSSATETKEERSYNELASELSQVAGKSEVVINAITDGVLALDGQGVIQLINPAAQEIIGWGKHDALNLSYKSVLKLVNAKNAEVTDAEDPVAQALNSNKPIKTDTLSIQTQSGKNFLAAISVSPVGQLGNGVIVVFRDVTAEKSDERQRAEFISTASHEMRTPVAAIEGYLGLALNPATAQIDDKARDFIGKAHESAQHLGHLFSDLLDVSKADDGRLKNDPTVIDVVPFIHEIVQGLTPKAVEKGLRILYKPMPDGDNDEARRINPVFYVNVDRDHLREVSNNLIENAIKYTPKGDVIIDVTGDEAHVVLSVTDTGIGIPREDQTHLFQKFYRVDNSDTREIGGTGLGLYLCRRLAETMGGRIWVESEYKKGSTFYVELGRIDHDEATRLIEQASILAEQRAAAEAEEAARDAEQTKAAEAAFITSAPQSFAPPPAPAPAAAPQPIVVAPTPQPLGMTPQIPAAPVTQQYAAPQAPVYRPQAAPLPNTPLSSIEANPSQYISRPADSGISVPPRQQ
jgi:PAS domain S-box-containing protein